jgi:hypothetical protein
MPQATKISPQEAANTAMKYLKELVPIQSNVTVEEVELNGRENEWHITLGYIPADIQTNVYFGIGQKAKEYKEFRVNAVTGKVLSMKIRKIA